MTSKNKLTDYQQTKLLEASKAHDNLAQATAQRITAIKAAVDAGVPMATVAKEIEMIFLTVQLRRKRANK